MMIYIQLGVEYQVRPNKTSKTGWV